MTVVLFFSSQKLGTFFLLLKFWFSMSVPRGMDWHVFAPWFTEYSVHGEATAANLHGDATCHSQGRETCEAGRSSRVSFGGPTLPVASQPLCESDLVDPAPSTQ